MFDSLRTRIAAFRNATKSVNENAIIVPLYRVATGEYQPESVASAIEAYLHDTDIFNAVNFISNAALSDGFYKAFLSFNLYIRVLTHRSKPTNRNWDYSQIDEFLTKSFSENENVAKTLRRIFLFLYLQFAFYWATIAAGMFVNYYYAVPSTVQANFSSIFLQIFAAPSLFAHVTFAVLSTSMSIPLIVLARRVGLRQVVLLHSGAITSRLVGFVAGPLFIYYSTSSMSNAFSANISTFTMASVFLIAVILTFLSRIFIVREDVRIKFATPMQTPLVGR